MAPPAVAAPKNQWKSNRGGENTTPHQQEMREPSDGVSFPDEIVEGKLADHPLEPRLNVANSMVSLKEDLPATFPVERCWRPLQPDRIPVDNPSHGEERSEGVGHQGRIKVGQVP